MAVADELDFISLLLASNGAVYLSRHLASGLPCFSSLRSFPLYFGDYSFENGLTLHQRRLEAALEQGLK